MGQILKIIFSKKALRFLIVYGVIQITYNLYLIDFWRDPRHSSSLGYIVDQGNCKIIDIDINEHFYFKGVDNVFQCGTQGQLVIQNDTHIFLNEGVLRNYDIGSKNDVTCTYYYFWRDLTPKPPKYERFHYTDGTRMSNEGQKMDEEFVKVNCTYVSQNGAVLSYRDYYSFTPTNSRDLKNRSENSKYNVLIVGIDSVSRLNFHRNMPQTYDFISRNLSAVEFLGYTKVGLNTFPNLMAVLTGLSVSELRNTCWPDPVWSRFDTCKFIWESYHDEGYKTAFAEEGAGEGLFANGKNGFLKQPVDHMWENWEEAAANDIGKFLNARCLGEKLNVELLLENSRRFLKSYRSINKKYFAIYWTYSITHNYMNYGTQFDQIYLQYFKDLQSMGMLKDTIVFFMGDHGYYEGDYLRTYTGRLENRLPLFFVLTPHSFKETHPEAYNNLINNTRKLTTPFDLHDTLKDIVTEDFTSSPVYRRGISIFKPIPSYRSCESVGLTPHWCTCFGKPLPTNWTLAQSAAKVAIMGINRFLENETKCIEVTLDKIIDVATHVTKQGTTYINVMVQCKTSGALFEATVTCKNCSDDFELDGLLTETINRNNQWRRQSHCASKWMLRPYCYCKDRLWKNILKENALRLLSYFK